MQITQVERVLKYDGRELADLNPNLDVDDVVAIYSKTMPELATAVVEGPEIVDGKAIYTLATRLGTKG